MTFNEERVEQIARRYCELAGLDQEQVMVSMCGCPEIRRWQQVVERIKDEWTMEAARYDSPVTCPPGALERT